jgi:amino acid permease
LRYTSFMSLSFIFFLMIIVILFACNIAGFDPCADNDDSSGMLSASDPTAPTASFATNLHRLLTQNTVSLYVHRLLSSNNMLSSTEDDGQCVGDRVNVQFNANTMKVFSIFIFGFTCHQNMFTIVNELQAVTLQRCNLVIAYAVGTAVCVYLVIANCGYSTYGDKVESNILVSYPSKPSLLLLTYSLLIIIILLLVEVPIVSVVRCFVSLLVSFTYPLQCNPARKCVMTLLASIFKDEEKPPGVLEHAIFLRYVIVTVSVLPFI